MPDAPAPTYDSHGNKVAPWKVTVTYSPDRDEITVHEERPEGDFLKGINRVTETDGDEIEEVVILTVRALRLLGSPRLF